MTAPPLPSPFSRLPPTWLIAHRGGAALAPENTLFVFERAIKEHGADMLELDVHPTLDGELAVIHDATLDRTTNGSGPVGERTMGELRRLDAGCRFGEGAPWRGKGLVVPTLDEVLERFPRTPVHVELKSRGGAKEPGERLLASALARHGALARACVGSEDDELAERIAAAIPGVSLFYPRSALVECYRRLRAGEPLRDEPYAVLSMPLALGDTRLVDAELIRAARAAGRWVNAWTVDDPEDMRRLVADGVGGIMTDRPDLLRALLGPR